MQVRFLPPRRRPHTSAARESATRSPTPGPRAGAQGCFASNPRRVRFPRGPHREDAGSIPAGELPERGDRRPVAGQPGLGCDSGSARTPNPCSGVRFLGDPRRAPLDGGQPVLKTGVVVSSPRGSIPSALLSWPRGLLARLAPSHGAGPGLIPGGVTARPLRLGGSGFPVFTRGTRVRIPQRSQRPPALECAQRYERRVWRFESSRGYGSAWRPRASFISLSSRVRVPPLPRKRRACRFCTAGC